MALPLIESIFVPRRIVPADLELVQRAEYLEESDRCLLEAVIVKGQSMHNMAKAMGVFPCTVRKRVYALRKRLRSRQYIRVARALRYLGEKDEFLAMKYFCRGISLREICTTLSVSMHVMRRRMYNLRAQIDLIDRMVENAHDMRDIPLPANSKRRPA